MKTKRQFLFVIIGIIFFCSVLLKNNSVNAAVTPKVKDRDVFYILVPEIYDEQDGTKVELSLSKGNIIIKIIDNLAEDGRDATYRCLNPSCSDYDKLIWGTFKDGQAILEHSYAGHTEAFSIRINERLTKNPNTYCSFLEKVSILDNQFQIKSPAYIQQMNLCKELDNQVDKYTGIPGTYKNLESLEKIKEQVQELVKNCNTTEEKVQAFHDWIAQNISYAYTKEWQSNSSDLNWIWENSMGQCKDYSLLMNLFCGIENIPCVSVVGCAGDEKIEKGAPYEINHVWNMIYIDGAWYMYDVTWDSANYYWGNGQDDVLETYKNNSDKTNISNLPAKQNYVKLDPLAAGKDHMPIYYFNAAYPYFDPLPYMGGIKSLVHHYKFIKGKKITIEYIDEVSPVKEYTLDGNKKMAMYINAEEKEYKIIGIGKYAFAKSSVTTLNISNKNLQKKYLKNCLKGSKVTTVIINSKDLGSQKVVNNIKKWFSDKSIVGKKVKVVVK